MIENLEKDLDRFEVYVIESSEIISNKQELLITTKIKNKLSKQELESLKSEIEQREDFCKEKTNELILGHRTLV